LPLFTVLRDGDAENLVYLVLYDSIYLGRKTMPAFIDMHKQKARDILCDEKNCAFLGYYAVCSGNSYPTFQDNLSVPSSRVRNPSR